MGSYVSRFYHRKDRKVLLLGTSNTGKTSFLSTLQKLTKKPPYTKLQSPTIGFNTDTIVFNDKTLLIWDLGGSESIQFYWKCYYVNVRGIIYFFDTDYFDTSCELFDSIVEEVKCFYIIVVANEDERVKKRYGDVVPIMECGQYDAFAVKEIITMLTNSI